MRTCELLAFLCLNTHLHVQGKSQAPLLGRMRIRLAEVINAFAACFATQAKENTRFNTFKLLHYFHQATCPIKHMVCL